ncbi:hypothetical protein A6V39_00935 [Candidatus Mycoplasma haematobovis]|uniref:Uncharacterized protein n=1 Tax=Candidatus Mycoplasma haematobovis TaxID=432608 RepID=A0A1A9QDS0_9MOLU|nr:hypothetical protein [Candidatus Mycoplasma haematobovis]OAL10617.1 hypothetical protein A6V39_00935 [Candidatus Mycoplasma haematobovis]
MALSKGGIITAGLLSTGGIGGSIALGYYLTNTSKETFRDKLSGTLLTNEQADDAKWTARVTLLSNDNSNTLTQELRTIKGETGNDKVQKIKNWCNKNLNNNYSDDQQLLTNLRKYCAYNVKDKLTKAIDTGSWDANTHDKKLKDAQEKDLSDNMKNIKIKLTTSGTGANTNALKEWCVSLDKVVFKGTNDQNFKDAQEYCETQ